MVRILYRHHSGTIVLDLAQDQLFSAVRDKQCTIWVDMEAPTQAEYQLVLEKVFQFHPLAIEDTIKDVHVPKVDDYGSYLYVVLHTFALGDERMDIHTSELDLFLGPNFLVTVHNEPRPLFEKFWQEQYHRTYGLAQGTAMLLYELLDRQIDSYIPLLDDFETRLEDLGDLIFQMKHGDENVILNDLLTAKSTALRLRRILLPQRQVLHRLSQNDYSAVPAAARIYYHDVYDHLARLADLAESTRDLTSSTIETHLALANNRMNDIMKVLTVISTIFIPMSFIASLYGMNFEFMPELTWRWSYPTVLLLFFAIGFGMVYMFRQRRWL